MTDVLSSGSTSTSNCRQPGSLRAALAFSTHFCMKLAMFSGLILIFTCRTRLMASPDLDFLFGSNLPQKEEGEIMGTTQPKLLFPQLQPFYAWVEPLSYALIRITV